MSVLEREGTFSEDSARALFEEARERTRRRRRRRWAAAAAMAAGLGALAFAIVQARGRGRPGVLAQTAGRPFADLRAFEGHGDLAFLSRAGLWVLDGRAGVLRAVSPPRDRASAPRFSPDGRWLTYATSPPTASTVDEPWLARANGTGARGIPGGGIVGFLADGRLVAGGRQWRITSSLALVDAGPIPADLLAWAPDGSAYAFVAHTRHEGAKGSWSETDRLELSASLHGPRTTWFSSRIAFTRSNGTAGGDIGAVFPLSGGRGVLFRLIPHSASAGADGLKLYELRRPLARPVDLGVTVGLPISIGANDIALTRGANRYAWVTKRVSVCAARCTAAPTAPDAVSLDPALSAEGALAYVQARSGGEGSIGMAQVKRWYATHRLWILPPGAGGPREVSASAGAAVPVWSADGRSILYVSGDALWLLRSVGSKPVRVASPLFGTRVWASFYGEVDWSSDFAWSAS